MGGDLVEDLAQDRLERHGRERRLLLTGLRAGEDEHRVEQPLEPGRRLLDVAQESVAGLRVVLGAVLQDLDRARDRRHRRPQLMRGVLDEVLFHLPALSERTGNVCA